MGMAAAAPIRRYNSLPPKAGRKQSAHVRVVMGSAGCDCRLRGECLHGRSPGPAEHEVVQDVHGDVVAGQAAGYLLLGFQRADAALADVIQPSRGLHVMRQAGSIRIWCG
jgi:hypothetical protein